jgi:aminoglycoside phosphotransferase (APT) family kinase protein
MKRPEWSADIELNEAAVRALVGEQFPDVSLAALAPFATGWDNALWVTGEGIAFRFPRRAIAVPGVEREIATLPALAPELPLPIPVPLLVGRPTVSYPWPFFATRLLPGREIAEVSLDGRRTRFGVVLAEFLRALHDPALLAAHGGGLPRDPMGRADVTRRVPATRARLRSLGEAGYRAPSALVEQVLDEGLGLAGADGGEALLHGDLHVRHVLVSDEGAPTAVIDWGDICRGDPAVDLSLYWSVLDPDARDAFRGAYGETALTPGRLIRARVLALSLNAALAVYALDTGQAALWREAVGGIDRSLVD